jgi:hypothetical protein
MFREKREASAWNWHRHWRKPLSVLPNGPANSGSHSEPRDTLPFEPAGLWTGRYMFSRLNFARFLRHLRRTDGKFELPVPDALLRLLDFAVRAGEKPNGARRRYIQYPGPCRAAHSRL